MLANSAGGWFSHPPSRCRNRTSCPRPYPPYGGEEGEAAASADTGYSDVNLNSVAVFGAVTDRPLSTTALWDD